MIPEKAKRKGNNHLAEGEATGHYHAATGDKVSVFEDQQSVYLDNPDGCEVEHQEHKTIAVPAGKFRVEKVQEFDHAKQEVRRVQD